MRRTAALFVVAASGCIDSFQGSNVQFDFSPAMPVEASVGATPGAGEVPANVHFTFYALEDGLDAQGNPVGRMFAVQDFEIHHIVDLASPCFIDVGSHVPYPGLHVSQYLTMVQEATGISDVANPPPTATTAQEEEVATAIQRDTDVKLLGGPTGIKVVSSASDGTYGPVAADCVDGSKIPPPTCTDPDSNKRRLEMCQAAWKADPSYFEGTDRVLTAPLDGVTHGMVDGMNPVNLAPVGGAQFYVTAELAGFSSFAIFQQTDDTDGPGTLLMYGTATMNTLGVQHVHMTSPASPALTAEVAIFGDLSDDDPTF
ncbi:MAG TPA: hypothetical protein VLX92_11945 [Kofleriaceae bacterium]|nr:hypothetical protein [Kofleriaceae bacterium]